MGHMLLVHLEDDGPLREILSAALKAVEPDCQIKQFFNSDDALRFIEQSGSMVDLFILDIRVPGSIDGLGVAHKIREIKCPGAIVLTSAYQTPDKAVIQQLASEWFPKPWHILETTSRLLKIAHAKRAATKLAVRSTPVPPRRITPTPPANTTEPDGVVKNI